MQQNVNFTIYDFLQKTAFPLEIAARFQLNLFINPIPKFNMYKNVPKKFMPILWFEQHVQASETVVNLVKLVLAAPKIGQIIGWILFIVGLALTLTLFCKHHDYEVASSEILKTEIRKTSVNYHNNNNNLPEMLPMLKK